MGLVLFILIFPGYEKLRSLKHIAAEFSTGRVLVQAEAQAVPGGQGRVQEQIENQMSNTQTELAAAVDSILATLQPMRQGLLRT